VVCRRTLGSTSTVSGFLRARRFRLVATTSGQAIKPPYSVWLESWPIWGVPGAQGCCGNTVVGQDYESCPTEVEDVRPFHIVHNSFLGGSILDGPRLVFSTILSLRWIWVTLRKCGRIIQVINPNILCSYIHDKNDIDKIWWRRFVWCRRTHFQLGNINSLATWNVSLIAPHQLQDTEP
jgi:hypothetical protein